MRLRRCSIVSLSLAAVAVAAMMVAVTQSDLPLAMTMVDVAKQGATKQVTIEFRRLDPAAHFTGNYNVQLRKGGRWETPPHLPKIEGGNLFSRTNSDRIVWQIHAEADACRFSFEYRLGLNPYCRAYFFAQRVGLSQAFPKLTHAALRLIPQRSRLQHAEFEASFSEATARRCRPRSGLAPAGHPAKNTMTKQRDRSIEALVFGRSCPVF